MAQIGAVTGFPQLKKKQTAELNARLSYLPQYMAQQSQAEYQEASINDMKAKQKLAEQQFGLEEEKLNLSGKQFGLEEKRFGLSEQEYGLREKGMSLQEQQARQAETEFGWQQTQAERAEDLRKSSEQKQMGVQAGGLGFNLLSGKMGSGITVGGLLDKAGGLRSWLLGDKNPPTAAPRTGGAYNLNLGAMAGGGLMGFGAGQAFGGDNKVKKTAIGAGVGGLAGLLGSSGDWGSALGGGLLGGLGSLF